MPGVRIHHRTRRDCVVQIPHLGRQTPSGPKLYNVTLDAEGDAIVSETVWQRVQEALGLLGQPSVFLVMNQVQEPPALILDTRAPARERRVVLPDGREANTGGPPYVHRRR